MLIPWWNLDVLQVLYVESIYIYSITIYSIYSIDSIYKYIYIYLYIKFEFTYSRTSITLKMKMEHCAPLSIENQAIAATSCTITRSTQKQ